MTAPLPPGVRNRNPGNLNDLPGRPWRGQVGVQNGRCVFDTADSGLRALCIQLLVDQIKWKCKTPEQIITRWAPPSQNNTKAYIDDVCTRTGFFAIEPIDLMDMLNLYGFALAIIWHENGMQPYSYVQIARACRDALA